MMIFFWKVVVTLICSAVILLIFHVKRRRSHPPGPLGFPLVGLLPLKIIQIIFSNYLPKFSDRIYYKQMNEKYGELWSAEMGGQRIIVFGSMKLVTEAFVNNANLFSPRPDNEVFRIISDKQGIIFVNGQIWKDNRQMAIRALREFGMGKIELVNHICDEGNELIKYLTSISSKPINTSFCFIKAVSNVITRLVFNEGNNYDDPEFDNYIKRINCIFQSKVFYEECIVFPKFSTTKLGRFLFPNVDNFFKSWDVVKDFVRKKCSKKFKSAIKNETPECVFDYFWKNRYQHEEHLSDEEKLFGILLTIVDLYNAGSDTSNSFIKFSCLMLGRYQDVQDDLRKEVRKLTDDYSRINMDMRKDCPKLLSFMDEIHRYCNIVLTVLRAVTEPCIFMGYKLYPEDVIYMDIGTVSRDPNLFSNPDVFNPYRFMDESKTQYVPHKNLIPFGIGKRVCIGESIANMETFLFLSRIIHNFHISLTKNVLDNFHDIFEGNVGITHGPLDYDINLKPI